MKFAPWTPGVGFQREQRAAKRGPLSTFAECAEKLGVSEAQLKGLFASHKDRPAPALHSGGSMSYCARKYYQFSEVKRWFAGLSTKAAA